VKRYIRKSGLKDYSILDAGCGRQAALGWDIREECEIYFGIDRDIPSVRISNLKLITGEVEKAMSTIKDSSLDYVVSLALIEHLEEPGMFLRDIHRVLKNGGRVLLTTPPPISEPILELLSFLKIINGDEIDEHKNYFTKKTLNELLSENGFEVLELKKFLLGFNLFAVGKK
jgi:SAM-dependent methyltransferase